MTNQEENRMTDKETEQKDAAVEPEVVEIDYKAELDKAKADLDKYKRENTDFFTDMKKYKQKAKEYEEVLAKTNKVAEESKTYQERYESLSKQYEKEKVTNQKKQNAYDQERIRNKAMTLANNLQPLDDDAADMLADYLEKRLKMTEDGIAILDKDGKLSNLKEVDLKEEFKAVERYKRLMRGRDSSGSGAAGSGKVSGTSNLDQYAKMKPADRLTALREAKAE